MALSYKQQRFVAEYLKDFNGSQAAIRAGYSERSSRSTASELLTNPNVSAAIKAHIMSADEVAMRLTDIARGDIADLMTITPSGFVVDLTGNNERGINPKTKLIRKIKQKVTTVLAKEQSGEDKEIIETEIELYSAHDALRDIGRYHKMFTDSVDLNVNAAIKGYTTISPDDWDEPTEP